MTANRAGRKKVWLGSSMGNRGTVNFPLSICILRNEMHVHGACCHVYEVAYDYVTDQLS